MSPDITTQSFVPWRWKELGLLRSAGDIYCAMYHMMDYSSSYMVQIHNYNSGKEGEGLVFNSNFSFTFKKGLHIIYQ